MTKLKKIIGIDISKENFDVAFYKEEKVATHKYAYNDKAMRSFAQTIDSDSLCIMESTGTYHLRLAHFLYELGVKLYVVNPMSVKRFIQSTMSRSKTDKSDAIKLIEYASVFEHKLWKPTAQYYAQVQQLQNVQNQLIRERTSTNNQLEAINNSVIQSQAAIETLKRQLEFIAREIDNIDNQIELLIVDNNDCDIDNIVSIPGIGRKTAIAFIACTSGAKEFSSYKQVAAYFGLAPRIVQSGKSVRGKSHICKMGFAYIRMLLYMCARSAKKYNLACKEMYERLVENGKAKKLALIAVANKLIKQIFAIIKSKQKYCENYRSKFAF